MKAPKVFRAHNRHSLSESNSNLSVLEEKNWFGQQLSPFPNDHPLAFLPPIPCDHHPVTPLGIILLWVTNRLFLPVSRTLLPSSAVPVCDAWLSSPSPTSLSASVLASAPLGRPCWAPPRVLSSFLNPLSSLLVPGLPLGGPGCEQPPRFRLGPLLSWGSPSSGLSGSPDTVCCHEGHCSETGEQRPSAEPNPSAHLCPARWHMERQIAKDMPASF